MIINKKIVMVQIDRNDFILTPINVFMVYNIIKRPECLKLFFFLLLPCTTTVYDIEKKPDSQTLFVLDIILISIYSSRGTEYSYIIHIIIIIILLRTHK